MSACLLKCALAWPIRWLCAQLYTFFMYLSTPEEAGGTRFTDLNLTVPAVKGTAVLWPSVTNEDPSIDEPNTNHEGLPPSRGVKCEHWFGGRRALVAALHATPSQPQHN